MKDYSRDSEIQEAMDILCNAMQEADADEINIRRVKQTVLGDLTRKEQVQFVSEMVRHTREAIDLPMRFYEVLVPAVREPKDASVDSSV